MMIEMEKRYILNKTSRLYEASTGESRHMILIYGDEVEALGVSQNNRERVVFRKREGWVKEEHLGTEPVLELYFIDVGQGDSTFIVTPGRKKILVDGGINDRALRFLAWKYRLYEVDPYNPLVIDLLVTTHADEDHIGGLIPIIGHPKIRVKEIIHSGLATYKSGVYSTKIGSLIQIGNKKFIETRHNSLAELVDSELSDTFLDWKSTIQSRGGIHYHAVNASSPQINIGDPPITLEVIGPKLEKTSNDEPIYRWFGSDSKTINGHSILLSLSYGNVALLLSGDINEKGSDYLMEDPNLASRMDAHVLKAPHHGSHGFDRAWLDAVNPQISIISSGDEPDHGHPRAIFVGAVGSASRSNEPLIFSTEIAATFEDVGEDLDEVIDLGEEELEALDDSTLMKLRKLFKRRLHGMINVRTDGKELFAARRVAAPWWWESYGSIEPAHRSIP